MWNVKRHVHASSRVSSNAEAGVKNPILYRYNFYEVECDVVLHRLLT